MILLQSETNDPYYNLALEQALFEAAAPDQSYCMLWQNRPAVIIGNYQNALQEVNLSYLQQHQLPVVRRLSGGGAVYHDLGGLNYTFIVPGESHMLQMETFCLPVLRTCKSFGIEAEISGRNDVLVCGRKFSGTAAYTQHEKTLHHGCLMIDSDIHAMEQALTPSADKFRSKAAASVRSRVANLSEFCPTLTVRDFRSCFISCLPDVSLLPEIPKAVRNRAAELKEKRYQTWDWNFGKAPLYSMTRQRHFAGCGSITAQLDIIGGRIQSVHFYGDFFSRRSPAIFADALTGCQLIEEALSAVCAKYPPEDFFQGIHTGDFIQWLAIR